MSPEEPQRRKSSSASAGSTSPSASSRPQRWPGSPHAAPGSGFYTNQPLNTPGFGTGGQMSPDASDRVYPIRSVVSVDPTPTPSHRPDREHADDYFHTFAQTRRVSLTSTSEHESIQGRGSLDGSTRGALSVSGPLDAGEQARKASLVSSVGSESAQARLDRARNPAHVYNDIVSNRQDGTTDNSSRPSSVFRALSMKSAVGEKDDNGTGLLTARFRHVVSEGGHAIITGRDGETLQRCEDEPIHIPGAVQGFGLLIALAEESEGKFVVRVVSENSKRLIGYTPRQLFALDSFTDILSDEQADNLLDHVDFIRDEEADVDTNGPEVFTMSIRSPVRRMQKLWCAMHINDRNPGLIICEFELEDDPTYPLVPPNEATPEPPEDTLNSAPTAEELADSTENASRPLRVLRSARKRKGEAAAMEVFNIMSQVQEQLAAAPSIERFLKTLVGVVKELTGFHRVMVYQFDSSWNGRVVTELVDPRATSDLYKGLNFPASDIPKQARDLYKVNKVRMLYDRDQETARLVCRTVEDLETPLDMTYSNLRAMSPIHIKYLANMAVRSSMSISINVFEELWGLIACHSYGAKGMRVSFPIRKMCRLVGDSASRNIERLSYAKRLQARKLINTAPSQAKPSGYIIASSEDLLKLFDADFGLLSIKDETKILGNLEHSQEALAMLEYLRMRRISTVMTSNDIREEFPDLRYQPGFKVIAGLLLVPLSSLGQDFIVFFRRGQLKEVKWAGNPYEKFVKEGTEGYLEPRKSFKTWSEKVVGKCREWTEEEIETAAVLCLVYGKFIEVWRQKEAALQTSQLTKLLLANSAHEVRTPLNAIINYLEIALEGSLDSETRENLSKSHSASKSLIYVINDLLDLTKTEEGGELIKDEAFDLCATLLEATDPFKGDARRKRISFEVIEHPDLPQQVIGDQRKIRQAISNITANAIQNTTEGGVKVELYLASRVDYRVEVEISVEDSGVGISSKRLDALFRELEQVQSEADLPGVGPSSDMSNTIESPTQKEEGNKRILGLGLAVVARIVRNMNGQLRLKSEEGKGSRFVVQLPFELPDTEENQQKSLPDASITSSTTAQPHSPPSQGDMVTLIERDSTRRNSADGLRAPGSRKNSTESMAAESMMSGRQSSLRSIASAASVDTQGSEADRLIEAISKSPITSPTPGIDRTPRQSTGTRSSLLQRHTSIESQPDGMLMRGRSNSGGGSAKHSNSREMQPGPPGEMSVPDVRTNIKSIRMAADYEGLSSPEVGQSGITERMLKHESSERSRNGPSADHMHVLVAEDDPVNSRIIKKRLDKAGHVTCLTVNGEECSSTYGEKSGFFDVVLMDMQMPIVDGLTSTKMIRSFEKSHPSHTLSARASLNGRVPIIAVSASLLERERKTYIDAGFDGWILKPVSFNRLGEILNGIVDKGARNKNLYQAGRWELGGWFQAVQKDIYAADTKPDTDELASTEDISPEDANARNGTRQRKDEVVTV